MKKFWQRLVLFGLTGAFFVSCISCSAANTASKVPILMYHNLTNDPSAVTSMTITGERFQEDMEYLEYNGYTPLLSADLIDIRAGKEAMPERPVMITFDDGYRSNYDIAYPILQKTGMKAVIALIGLLASLVPLISRVQAEESNKYYDIVLDYNSMRSMARQSSQSEDEWLDLFKSLGVDKVALSEASALNLHDNAAIPVHAMTVKKAAESYGWEDQYPAEVAQWLRESTDVSDAIIWTETAASYEWILNAFEARFEDFEAKTYLEGEHGFIFIQQQKNGMKGEKLVDYPVDEALEMTKTLDPVLIDVCNTISI